MSNVTKWVVLLGLSAVGGLSGGGRERRGRSPRARGAGGGPRRWSFLLASLAGCALLALPSRAPAQHAGGHGSHEAPTTPRERRPEPAGPRLLAPGAPRAIEVLALRDRFSPPRIEVEDGEEVVLLVRRSGDGYCDQGLEIAALATQVQLPTNVSMPIPIRPLGREESVLLRCLPDGPTATIVRSAASSKEP